MALRCYARGRSAPQLHAGLSDINANKKAHPFRAGRPIKMRYPRMRRRTTPANPISPAPIKDIVPGSGTEVGGPLEANPVCGPQSPPEAVQKWIAAPVNWFAISPGAVSTNVSVSALTVPFGPPFIFA